MADYTKNPRIVVSKKDCTCAESGQDIKKGQRCWFNPVDKAVYHLRSNKAKEFTTQLAFKIE